MTCVRFLETIPVIFERMSLSSAKLSQNFETISSLVFDFKWLPDLADWGRSSLVVVIRHWKKSILSLLTLIKGSCHMSMACTFDAIETIVTSGLFLFYFYLYYHFFVPSLRHCFAQRMTSFLIQIMLQ